MLSTPRLAVLFAAAVALLGAGPAAADHHMSGDEVHNHVAVCVLLPTIGNNVTGIIQFAEENGKIHVTGTVRGLTPGKHGFHVHEYGDISGLQDGKSTGGHFSPGGHDHGKPSDEAAKRHVGDLGNIEADGSGVAKIDFMDDVIALHGEDSIVGRGLVVHAGEDKFTQPTGDAGGRVAIGVIGMAKTPEAMTPPKDAPKKEDAKADKPAEQKPAEKKPAEKKPEQKPEQKQGEQKDDPKPAVEEDAAIEEDAATEENAEDAAE